MHEVAETIILADQIAQIHQMMKNMMTSLVVPLDEPVKDVTYASKVACVYNGGAHIFEDCSANPISVKYVSNKYNNLYNNIYNLGWRNQPKFSWSNNQN